MLRILFSNLSHISVKPPIPTTYNLRLIFRSYQGSNQPFSRYVRLQPTHKMQAQIFEHIHVYWMYLCILWWEPLAARANSNLFYSGLTLSIVLGDLIIQTAIFFPQMSLCHLLQRKRKTLSVKLCCWNPPLWCFLYVSFCVIVHNQIQGPVLELLCDMWGTKTGKKDCSAFILSFKVEVENFFFYWCLCVWCACLCACLLQKYTMNLWRDFKETSRK